MSVVPGRYEIHEILGRGGMGAVYSAYDRARSHMVAVKRVRLSEDHRLLESDCAPLHRPVMALLDEGVRVHCLRDLTRGGLVTSLAEIAADTRLRIEIDEVAVPVLPAVHAVCELLGLDPLYVANEGRFVAFVDAQDAQRAVSILARFEVSAATRVIGQVHPAECGQVVARTPMGTHRVLSMLAGGQLPRIC